MAFNPDKCMKVIAIQDTYLDISRTGSPEVEPVYFSKTGEEGTWESHNISLKAGEFAYMKGTDVTAKNPTSYTYFSTSGQIRIEGQITSLLNDGEGGDIPINKAYCFHNFLSWNSKILSISDDFLPSTILAPYCYSYLFEECNNLTVPNSLILPATNLPEGCYENMLAGTKIDNIQVSFTKWTTATTDWVKNIINEGKFSGPSELPIEYGDSKIPTSWRVVRPHIAGSVTFLNKKKIGGRVK